MFQLIDIHIFLFGLIMGFPLTTSLLLRMGWSPPHPYRFKCKEEGCTYEVGSNDKDLTSRMRDHHERDVHG